MFCLRKFRQELPLMLLLKTTWQEQSSRFTYVISKYIPQRISSFTLKRPSLSSMPKHPFYCLYPCRRCWAVALKLASFGFLSFLPFLPCIILSWFLLVVWITTTSFISLGHILRLGILTWFILPAITSGVLYWPFLRAHIFRHFSYS